MSELEVTYYSVNRSVPKIINGLLGALATLSLAVAVDNTLANVYNSPNEETPTSFYAEPVQDFIGSRVAELIELND